MNEDEMMLSNWDNEGGSIAPEKPEPAPLAPEPHFDLSNFMAEWENGNLEYDDCIRLFQHLVDTRLAWSLPGRFGRFAAELIRSGEVTTPQPYHNPAAAGISDFYEMGKAIAK